jgi:RNA polymerase sigma-70 factor (ECF subfamily)
MPDDHDELLAATFEAHRAHLRAVAYRMLGSSAEADDAVQEAWVRLSRSDTGEVGNIGGWLTTVVSRVCLNVLRSRRTRREEPLDGGRLGDGDGGAGAGRLPTTPPGAAPGPVSARPAQAPEDEAVLADSVGLALLVVLDTLSPAERLAFVLHDLFALPFDEVAAIAGRSPAAARQLASRARRRVQGAGPGAAARPIGADADVARQRRVVEAFLTAARGGDMAGLLAVLDPDVVLHADTRPDIHGAARVASGAVVAAAQAAASQLGLVDGAVGVVVAPQGEPTLVMVMAFDGDRIVDVDVISDPARLATVEVAPVP